MAQKKPHVRIYFSNYFYLIGRARARYGLFVLLGWQIIIIFFLMNFGSSKSKIDQCYSNNGKKKKHYEMPAIFKCSTVTLEIITLGLFRLETLFTPVH